MPSLITKRVKKIFQFIEQLTIPSGVGAGTKFKLRKFQRDFITDVYGPLNRRKRRQVRRAVFSLARKNGKTMLIACLVLVHLIGPEAIINGEIYSAANSREQAAKVFKYACQIVEADEELSSLIDIVKSTKTMICKHNGTVYRAVSADAGTNYGENPSLVIYDELAQAKNTDLYDALDTSMGAREEPLFIVISTQSKDPKHILSELIDDGLKPENKTTVCHLYEVPLVEDDEKTEVDIFDEKNWYLANPALGDFLNIEEMRDFAQKAKRMPSRENAFRNLYLNQRVDSKSPFIPRREWLACLSDARIEPGSRIYLALDLSGKLDLTAMVAVSDGDDDIIKAWFWKPEESLKDHEKRDRVPYTVWKSQGFIQTSPGRAIDYGWVANQVAEILPQYEVLGMAFDRWRIDDFRRELDNVGVDSWVEGKDDEIAGGLRMVSWGQGYQSMTPAIEAIELSVVDSHLKHDDNPVLTWNFANAMVQEDPAGNRKLDKSKSRFRIDGAQATTMAVGLKSRDRKESPQKSAYETENVEILTF